MTKLRSDFGARVKELREWLHLTRKAMTESLGLSFATVNRWENGWTVPSELALRQIDLLCKENHLEPMTDTNVRSSKPRADTLNQFDP
jgi:DNA-binding transcriptional regulator YiaG